MEISNILTISKQEDYELLDSGDGEKLERFGKFTLSRPDPQALWRKRLDEKEWMKADAYFTREGDKSEWVYRKKIDKQWNIGFGGLNFIIKPTAFKHTGLFPEQLPNWEWAREKMKGKTDVEVLNLFGYTGGMSLACAQAGASVVHIDSSKSAVAWARENALLSGVSDKPIRWIVEDARIFVEREIKRGRQYDAIIMDPPAFGHGTKNELWKIEENLLPLVENIYKILKPTPLFFIVNGYSAGYSSLAYKNMLAPMEKKFDGKIEMGELAIEESKGGTLPIRSLPAGIYARYSSGKK